MNDQVRLFYGRDVLVALRELEDESIQCVVTSPPYWRLRDYGVKGQIGLERTPEKYVARIVEVFREVRRVLRTDGVLWLVIGDSSPKKNLVGIPWMLAFALRADGWLLRSDIIWSKSNGMPESVKDRPTRAHEYIFLFSKSKRYFYDSKAIHENATSEPIIPWSERKASGEMTRHGGSFNAPALNGKRKVLSEGQSKLGSLRDKQRGHSRRHAGFNARWDKMTRDEQTSNGRNKRSVWTIATQPYPEAHFATFPREIPRLCILAGTPPNGVVLDPFSGSGTTGEVAVGLGRKFIGIDLNKKYLALAKKRIGLFACAS